LAERRRFYSKTIKINETPASINQSINQMKAFGHKNFGENAKKRKSIKFVYLLFIIFIIYLSKYFIQKIST